MSENALNAAFREIGLALEPLRYASSPRTVTELIADLGYLLPGDEQFPALPDLVINAEAVLTQLVLLGEAETDEARFEAAIAIGGAVVELVAEIHSLTTKIASAVSSIGDFVNDAPLDQLPGRLLDYLLVEYTARHRPALHGTAMIAGLFEYVGLAEDLARFQPATQLRVINWDHLPRYFSEPDLLFDEIYGWRTDFDSAALLDRLAILASGMLLPGGTYPQRPTVAALLGNTSADLNEFRLPVFQHGEFPDIYMQFGLAFTPAEARAGDLKGLGLFPYLLGTGSFTSDLGEDLELSLESSASIDAGLGIVIRHGKELEVVTGLDSSPADAGTFSAELQLKQREGGDEIIFVGTPDATRLSIQGPSARVFVVKKLDSDLGFEVSLEAIRLVVAGGDGDGFLSMILGDGGVDIEAGLTIGMSLTEGFFIRGSGGLEIRLPTHINVGPLEVQEAIIGLKLPDSGALVLDAGTTIKVELGPFTAVVENMGLSTSLTFPEGGSNLGPADLAFSFKPPTGVGLSLDTPAVRGGGYLFFDPENEQYGGALELSIGGMFTATAVGLITTRLPDGSKGFSLLVLINVQFTPGFALGMGFFLSGLGGLIGINRTIDEGSLREGVRTGALDHVLFPENVVANINRIISDIRSIFPPQRDQFMIGLMAKITWGTPALVSIEFGIIIEFKRPTRLAILGVLQVALPTQDDALLLIRVSFAGVINFDEKYLTFGASLFGSRILTFTLEGDMALRLNWGSQPAFLMSVGGFHPAFEPPARLNVGNLKPLTLNILTGNPRLTLTTYFALTSNTVQFGAKIDFYFKVSKFKAVGFFGFDVLFQFSPFRFVANVRAGLAIKIGSATLLSISLSFELAGPTPWSARGTGSFRILFFKVKVRFSKTWGERKTISPPRVPILPELLQALEENRNWTAEIPRQRFPVVSLRELDPTVGVVVESFGSLQISQNMLPLDLHIDRYGTSEPSDIARAAVRSVRLAGVDSAFDEVRDNFAPAAFVEMEDKDQLKAPSYVSERSGIRVRETDAIAVNYAFNKKVEHEVRTSDFDREGDEPRELFEPLRPGRAAELQTTFCLAAGGGAAARSPLAQELRAAKKQPMTQLSDEGFAIATVAGLARFPDTAFTVGTEAEANDQLRRLVAEHPELADDLQIVADYQLST